MPSQETRGLGISGAGMLVLDLVLFAAAGAAFAVGAGTAAPLLIAVGIIILVAAGIVSRGFFIIQPNEAEVLVLFGRYHGTVRESGWYWTNPFVKKSSVSLRIHNFNTPQLKVNDLDGNPIEIAAVVAWRVIDTARASFDVENYQQFIQIQAETALRHVASKYPYDITLHPDAPSLRGSSDEVLRELKAELQERLTLAGLEITDARLSHLAYAAEIAGAMLQRQQATAILAARARIVEGATTMVEGVIKALEERQILQGMSQDQRAEMVRSLLIVLTSERGATPILSATN